MAKLPLTPLGRIIKNGGAERVSENAKVALSEYLEDVSVDITKYALKNAEKEGRKTLKAEDIDVAFRNLF
ncbi:MAG: histone [Methanosphaera sp. rholeuAM6]|nr:MAG: histone [Methanosphaera sp. rholeuAM6]